MNNTTTHETAQKLKEAGFPQPTPEAGQFWYNPDFGLFVVGRRWFVDGRRRNIFYFETGQALQKEEWAFDSCIFAPTATDILHNIGHSATLQADLDEFYVDASGEFYKDFNPAEAVAEAWFSAKESEK